MATVKNRLTVAPSFIYKMGTKSSQNSKTEHKSHQRHSSFGTIKSTLPNKTKMTKYILKYMPNKKNINNKSKLNM